MTEPLTFGSLFAGIGGFDLGFERAGMVCKWQVEIDDYATRVLEKHWPQVRRHDDICTFPPKPAGDWRVDVVCGGFPCQDISYAGKGAGLAGARSGLFYEAMRVIREVEPRYVVLENVAALLTRGLDQVLGTLASFGFDAEWHCIPAAAVGAPHVRDRVWVLGWNANSGYVNPIKAWREQNAIARRIGKRKARRVDGGKISATIHPDADSLHVEGLGAIRQQEPRTRRTQRQLEGSGHRGREQWSTEPAVGRVANGVPSRVDRLRGLGNAVVPQVAQWIGERLVEHHNADA